MLNMILLFGFIMKKMVHNNYKLLISQKIRLI